MDTNDYDRGMLLRWRHYFPHSYWVNDPKEPLAEVRQQMLTSNPKTNQSEKSIFPLLTLSRVGGPVRLPEDNWSRVRTGLRASRPGEHYETDEKRFPVVNQSGTIGKFVLTYQLDIYSTERYIFDEIMIEVQENFQRNGTLNIDTGDDVFGLQSFAMVITDVKDTTVYDERKDSVPLYRGTITYTIDSIIYRRWSHLPVEQFILNYKSLNDSFDILSKIPDDDSE